MNVAICAPITLNALSHHLAPVHRDRLPSVLSGASVAQLALALLDRGWNVNVYTLGAVSEGVTLEGDQLRVKVGPYRPSRRARDYFKVERAYLAAELERDQPPLIHAHWTYEFALASLSTGLPTLITVRDWAPTILMLHRDPYRLVRWHMNRQVLNRGKHFTAVSPYLTTVVQGATKLPVQMIPNAIHDDLFEPRARTFPVPPHQIVSINNGFSRRKNVKALLKAFVAIRQALPETRLVLVGDGYEEGGDAAQWAISYSLAKGVQFLGAMPYAKVHALLAEASLLIHPSLEESFGMTLIEAMAKRTPAIGGIASGAVPWVLDGGRAGTLVDVRDPQQITRAAIELLGSVDSWESASRAGFDHASAEFRLSTVVDNYIAAYDMVLRS